ARRSGRRPRGFESHPPHHDILPILRWCRLRTVWIFARIELRSVLPRYSPRIIRGFFSGSGLSVGPFSVCSSYDQEEHTENGPTLNPEPEKNPRIILCQDRVEVGFSSV